MSKNITLFVTVLFVLTQHVSAAPNVQTDSVDSASNVLEDARRNPASIEVPNRDGDTQLGWALKRGQHDLALELLERSAGDVTWVNALGEGYVYLAAQAGFADVIRELADRRHAVLPAVSFFHFEDMDSPTLKGNNAFFAAANAGVLNELITQYRRGSKWYAGSYVRQINEAGESFLHAAARENRAEAIAWGSRYLCTRSHWSEGKWWNPIRFGSRTLSRATDVLQTYTLAGYVPAEGAMLFNHVDADQLSALHVAATKQSWLSIRALGSCAWMDYDLEDKHGNTALHTLLASLDPTRTDFGDDAHQTFKFLLNQTTRMRRWLISPSMRVNHRNQAGDTALHLAAKLKDPFFFNAAAEFGDVYATNKLGQTALEVRRQSSSGY